MDNARNLVEGIENHFSQALAISQAPVKGVTDVDPLRVFWLDMFQSKSKPGKKDLLLEPFEEDPK